METKQWWTFTFGYGQQHEGMYVRIYGTLNSARRKMFERYGSEWAFQYSERERRNSDSHEDTPKNKMNGLKKITQTLVQKKPTTDFAKGSALKRALRDSSLE